MNRRNFFGGMFTSLAACFGYNKVKAVERTLNPMTTINFVKQELPSDKDIERFREEWENSYRGRNSTGCYITTPGAKIEKWNGNVAEIRYNM